MYSEDLKSDHLKSGMIWNPEWSEIRNDLKSGLFEGRISNGPVFKWLGFSHLKTKPFEIHTIKFGFQMVHTRWQPFWSVFKWLCFRISNAIRNLHHLQTNLFLTIQNSNKSDRSDPHCIRMVESHQVEGWFCFWMTSYNGVGPHWSSFWDITRKRTDETAQTSQS